MLYFGEEIGERGMDNEPFSGVNGRTSIFDWWKVDSLQRLKLWISDKRKGLKKDEKKVLERYREVLALAISPVFSEGRTFDLCYCQEDGHFDKDHHFAFIRSDGTKTYLVVSNFGPASEISVRIPNEALDYLGIKLVRTVYTLEVPEKDFAVVELD